MNVFRYVIGTLCLTAGVACLMGAFGTAPAVGVLAVGWFGIGYFNIHNAIVSEFGKVDWNIMLDGLLEDRNG